MNEQYEKSLTKLELDKVLAMLSTTPRRRRQRTAALPRPSEHGRG